MLPGWEQHAASISSLTRLASLLILHLPSGLGHELLVQIQLCFYPYEHFSANDVSTSSLPVLFLVQMVHFL